MVAMASPSRDRKVAGDADISRDEAPDCIHDLGGLLIVRVVPGAFDDLESRVGDPCRELTLVLGWEHEVVPPGHHQRRYLDLAETLHHGPALHHLAEAEDLRLRPPLRATLREDHAHGREEARVGVVRTPEAHQRRVELPGRDPTGEPAPSKLYLHAAE